MGELTFYCRLCGMVLTPSMRVEDNRFYLSYYCADHPNATQDQRAAERPVEGD